MCAGGNVIMCYWYMHVLVVDVTNRACHGSASADDAAREKEFFFSSVGVNRQNTATFNDCTCAVIKPHAVIDGSYAVSFRQSVRRVVNYRCLFDTNFRWCDVSFQGKLAALLVRSRRLDLRSLPCRYFILKRQMQRSS